MPQIKSQTMNQISIMKFLLLMGVITVHSNIAGKIPADADYSVLAAKITDFVFIRHLGFYMPSFFILSGYLFFLNVERLTVKVYCDKLKRRVRTLLIPYVLWNVICLGILVGKSRLLGFDGIGIIENGEINWLNALAGFWVAPGNSPFPIAFAFWFIRNLMIFCLLSPVAQLICSRKWLLLLFISMTIFTDVPFYGFNWFVVGAALAIYGIKKPEITWPVAICALIICIVSGGLLLSEINFVVSNMLTYAIVCSGFVLFLKLSESLLFLMRYAFWRDLISSSFFIYGLHQCYCTVAAKFAITVIGVATFSQYMVSYFVVFVLLTLLPYGIFRLLKSVCPKLLNVLCGNRVG